MRGKIYSGLISALLILCSCTKEYDCVDRQILPAFVGFAQADLDSIFLRKFQAGNNFQNLVEEYVVTGNNRAQYIISNDTTTIILTDGVNDIRAGYDWQVFIPATNKTVRITEINSEKNKVKCGSGIFSMDKFGCFCINKVFSLTQDNQDISFPNNSDTTRYIIFINN
jgi:hypothetical protein